ncbi:plasmid recombination protein [Rhizobium sp. C4]|uniref:plasmid recombination protein n=1 Tax=Rhizobium sp. C4 TaxID=1349800 RepID=UPI001E5C09F6|nr:plasmid recombination protein [Rhizobium sp. C4]MCD2175348.1 plasmid recombination protein [Rhizobium sp. C4]
MAYQFIHLECYSRKADRQGRSSDFILDEAARQPIASVHVADPHPPTIIYGLDIEEVRAMHDTAAAAAMTAGARGRLRKIQSRQKTLHTVVASHPYTVAEVRTNGDKLVEVRDWEQRTVKWLRDQYGSALKSVIRHTDEKQRHIHAYIVPTSDPEMRAAAYHPGIVAKRAVMIAGPRPGEDGKALNKRSNAAYKAAMREWQDSYHDAVAVPCGLTRLGPARRRLTREEWKAEQAQARALQNALGRAAHIQARGQAYVDRTKAEAAAIRADAEKGRVAAERLKGIGGAIRSVADGIQQSRVREQIRREFGRDLAAAQALAERARSDAAREREARAEAEKRTSDARRAARHHAAAAAMARQEVRRLSDALAAALDEPPPIPGGPRL